MKYCSIILMGFILWSCSDSNGKDEVKPDVPDTTDPTTELTSAIVNTDTEHSLESVVFIDEKTGFIAGGDILDKAATVIKTTDGGVTWTPVLSETGYICNRITALSNQVLLVATNDKFILKTSDAGKTWKKVDVSTKAIFMTDIKFMDDKRGYLVGSNGSNGVLLTTKDGGDTWEDMIKGHLLQETFLHNNLLSSITFTSQSSILIGGGTYSKGGVLRSDDAGVTWTKASIDSDVQINNLAQLGDQVFAVGHNGQSSSTEKGAMYSTIDDGKTWTGVTTGFDNKLNSIAWRKQAICAVGRNKHNDLSNPEFIILSEDKGSTWTRIKHDYVVAGWNDVCFISDHKAIAVGYKGRAIVINLKQ